MRIAKRNFVLTMVLLSGLVIGLSLWNTAPNRAGKNATASPPPAAGNLPNLGIHNKLKGVARKAASVEWFISQRTYGLGYIPQDAEIRAVEDMRHRMIPELAAKGLGPKGLSLQKSAAGQLNWEFHGPGNIGGRVRGLVVHPDNPNILYVGSVSGGVWKSTDGGVSWLPTMNDLITLNISALEMKPGDPNTLYAGTGEAFFSIDNLPGRGILKTTDGGNTWKRVHVAQGLNSPFITAIAVSPANPNVVYASGRKAVPLNVRHPAETVPDPGVSAIFKSTDSGETWQDITTGKGIEHDPSNLADNFPADVVVSPTDANVAFGAFGLYYWGGIWKSTDGGQTWSRLTNGLPDPNLPNMGYGRFKLAMAPSDPAVLYASFTYQRKEGDTVDLKNWAMLGLWKTINGGQSWTQVTTPLTINQRNRDAGHTTALGSQGDYASAIIVHPTDPNIVFVGGLDIYKSTDGGNSWSQVSMWLPPGDHENPEGIPYVHEDHHVFAFDLSTNPPTLYNGSDGGVARSRDLGATWEILNQDLGVTQFYTFAAHPADPQIMFGGTQDNGTLMLIDAGNNDWFEITSGDGGPAYFDFNSPNTLYASIQYVNMFRYTVGVGWKTIGFTNGSNGITQTDVNGSHFFAPFEMSPNNPKVLALGTYRVLKTTNQGDAWTPLSNRLSALPIVTVAIAEGNDNIVWAATKDAKIFKTENNGTSWSEVTRPNLPNRFLTDIEFDPSNPTTVYLTYSGYGAPHVFKSTDAGAGWTNITNNLPDAPANTIQVHPQQPNLVFLGTDIGVFLSNDGGQTWQPCTNGFPTVQVTAIVLNPNTNRIVAATHGRGVYSAELSTESGGTKTLRNFDPQGRQVEWVVDSATPIDSGFVFGTNIHRDQAKATALQLPGGATQASVTEVKVWFGYKRSGLTNQTYRLEIYNGNPTTGPQGNAIFSQSYALANVLADDDFQTLEQPTIHALSQPVTVGSSFFVAINFGAYSQADVVLAAIEASDWVGQRVPEEWELGSDGTWRNVSDAWLGQKASPGSGTDGWRMWIEATVSASTAVDEPKGTTLPRSVVLKQNYPNPFNPETNIRYELPHNGNVMLAVFDLTGRWVATLASGVQAAGEHVVRWNGRDNAGNRVPSGIYFYRLEATTPNGGVATLTKKLTILK